MDMELAADLVAIWRTALTDTEARLRSKLPQSSGGVPEVGSAKSMLKVLEAFEVTTKSDGKTQVQAAQIAKSAGMDPRGMAGYYAAGLLKADSNANSRWISDLGKQRLELLRNS